MNESTKSQDLAHFISDRLKGLEAFTDQTAVHRKKFEFALSQLRKFSKHYSKYAKKHLNLDDPQIEASKSLKKFFQELRELMSSYLLQTWATSTIDNPSNAVLRSLKDIFTRMSQEVSIIFPDGVKYLDPNASEWEQYHILDLRAIEASFSQYLHVNASEKGNVKKPPQQAYQNIQNRLNSINSHLSNVSKDENTNLPAEASQIPVHDFSPIPINYRNWRVSIQDFQISIPTGSGVSATVFHAINKITKEEAAVKEFKWPQMFGSRLQSFQREVAVLANVNHPCLLKLIGATGTPPFCIITEWMPNGSLYQALHENRMPDPTMRSIAAFDIARGMQYLHAHQIVHRDLKSLNVLLDSNYHIRICDFGFSRHASNEQQMTSNIGTPHWMAPEILDVTHNYTSKVDVYAYGIVLWELVTSLTPYSGIDTRAIISEVRTKDIRPILPTSDVLNPSLRDLITQCWDRNPDVRPSFDEIVRRFEDDHVRLNGTDEAVFAEYIKNSATNQEVIKKKVCEIFAKAVTTREISLGAAVRKINKLGGIPVDLIDQIWMPEMIVPHFVSQNSIEKEKSRKENESKEKSNASESDSESSEEEEAEEVTTALNEQNSTKEKRKKTKEKPRKDLIHFSSSFSMGNRRFSMMIDAPVTDNDAAEYLLLFRRTSKFNEAARVLRCMRHGSMPKDVMCKFIAEVPTGSHEADADIIAAACANGCADYASLYATNDYDIALALLVCARNGVDLSLKAAVADKCVQCLAINLSTSKNDNENHPHINQNEEDNNLQPPNEESPNSNQTNSNEAIQNNESNDQNTNNENIQNNSHTNHETNKENENNDSNPMHSSEEQKIDLTEQPSILSDLHNQFIDEERFKSDGNLNEQMPVRTNSNKRSSLTMISKAETNPIDNSVYKSTDNFLSCSKSLSAITPNDLFSPNAKKSAALKCLIGMGELRRMVQLIRHNGNFLIEFLKSFDKSLRNSALLSCVSLAKENLLFSEFNNSSNDISECDEIFDLLLEMINEEELAAAAINLIVGHNQLFAEKLIQTIEQNTNLEINENLLKALIASAQIRDLRPKIKDALTNCQPPDELTPIITRFLALI